MGKHGTRPAVDCLIFSDPEMSQTSPAPATVAPPHQTLTRQLGMWGAVITGLGSMVGAGVYVSLVFAADLAGMQVLGAIILAGMVALCNGLSSAQLAAAHPVAGGTYEYGYRIIGPQAGFVAGWVFLCAKSASAASAALAFAGYVLNLMDAGNHVLLLMLALILVAGLTLLLRGGLRRTQVVNFGLVGVAVGALLVFIAVGLPRVMEEGLPRPSKFQGGLLPSETKLGEDALIPSTRRTEGLVPSPRQLADEARERELQEARRAEQELRDSGALPPLAPGDGGMLEGLEQPALPPEFTTAEQEPGSSNPTLPGAPAPGSSQAAPGQENNTFMLAAALMFVAFTGYGRIATLGEDIREPRRNIPRAIIITVVLTALLYLGVAAVYLTWLAPAREALMASDRNFLALTSAAKTAPLALVAETMPLPGLALIVTAGALCALLGVLLNLILGLSRVWLAMGRRGDMPKGLAKLEGAEPTPRAAILTAGIVVALIALIGDIRAAWSFSAFTVLIYYTLTNLAALRLPPSQRLYPKWVSGVGLGACILLASAVPGVIWIAGLAVLGAGIAWQMLVHPAPKPTRR